MKETNLILRLFRKVSVEIARLTISRLYNISRTIGYHFSFYIKRQSIIILVTLRVRVLHSDFLSRDLTWHHFPFARVPINLRNDSHAGVEKMPIFRQLLPIRLRPKKVLEISVCSLVSLNIFHFHSFLTVRWLIERKINVNVNISNRF